MPVAPPARATGRWPNTWKRRSSSSGTRLPDVEAVGGGIEAGVDGDRPLGQPRPGARPGRCESWTRPRACRSSRMSARLTIGHSPRSGLLRPARSGPPTGGHGPRRARVSPCPMPPSRPPARPAPEPEAEPSTTSNPCRSDAGSGRILAVVVAIAIAGTVGLRPVGPDQEGPSRDCWTDKTFADAGPADLHRRRRPASHALPPAYETREATARAEVVAQANGVPRHHARPPPAGRPAPPSRRRRPDDPGVARATGRPTSATGESYVDALAERPHARLLVSEKDNRQITEPIDFFAKYNEHGELHAPPGTWPDARSLAGRSSPRRRARRASRRRASPLGRAVAAPVGPELGELGRRRPTAAPGTRGCRPRRRRRAPAPRSARRGAGADARPGAAPRGCRGRRPGPPPGGPRCRSPRWPPAEPRRPGWRHRRGDRRAAATSAAWCGTAPAPARRRHRRRGRTR